MADVITGRSYGPAGEITAAEQRKVVLASSLGTVFEWYDFYLYGSLAAVIGSHFFSGLTESGQFIFALLAFAAGFFVRPFGAIFFGRIGDLVGRKYTFLITIVIMGLSTFTVGVLPTYGSIGLAAPIILIGLRLLQGLALGGEYGGAAIYVAEHSEPNRRGYRTSWIQTTATLGLFLSLIVILLCRQFAPGVTAAEKAASFNAEYGLWRVPFLVSIFLLAISVWIRLSLNESPLFKQMKEEGRTSKAPLAEAFGLRNGPTVLLALLGLTAGQAVVWYTGQFYALFFLTQTLKVDPYWAQIMIALSLVIGTPFFIVFGWLSDKIGRKPIIMLGCLLAILTYYPKGVLEYIPGGEAYRYPGIFELLTRAANPGLAAAIEKTPVTVVANPDECRLQFDPVGKSKFTAPCDVAKAALVKAGVPYSNQAGPSGAAQIKIGASQVIQSYDAAGPDAKAQGARFAKELADALTADGYPPKSPLQGVDWTVVGLLTILVIFVTMVYGPIAAMLVEMFPTRIRYTAMSLPYHIGNGWFGGFLPITAFTIVAATGNIYAGLMYPIIVAAMTFVIGVLFIRETNGRDITR
jgi:MFS family permease